MLLQPVYSLDCITYLLELPSYFAGDKYKLSLLVAYKYKTMALGLHLIDRQSQVQKFIVQEKQGARNYNSNK